MLIQLLHNEYIRLTLATMLICVAAIIVWLLLRHVKLWYSETGSVLEALDTISFRLEHVEDKLGIANQDTLGMSENIYAIGNMAEESRAIQISIHGDVKNSKETQEKIVEQMGGMHELLLIDAAAAKENNQRFVYEEKAVYDESYDDESYDGDEEYDDIEELWLDDLDDIFPEDDEDEIRKRIRL